MTDHQLKCTAVRASLQKPLQQTCHTSLYDIVMSVITVKATFVGHRHMYYPTTTMDKIFKLSNRNLTLQVRINTRQSQLTCKLHIGRFYQPSVKMDLNFRTRT